MLMINRFFRVIVLLAITMTLSWTSVAAAVSEDGFKDVDENDAHYEGIMALSEQGIINGYEDGTFQQWGELSRQHAAVVLYKLLNQRTTMENDLDVRSEEHTSELQARFDIVCRILPEKKKVTYA